MRIVECGHVTFRRSCQVHSHIKNHEFHFILRGKGLGVIQDVSYPFSENTLIYCPPGLPHQVKGPGEKGEPLEILYIQCRFGREHQEFKMRLEQASQHGAVEFDVAIIPQLDTVKQLFDSGNALLRESASLLFTSLLYRIFAQPESLAGPGSHQYIDEAIRLLRNNIYTRISNNTLAERLQLHPSYLIRLFKKHTGTTPAKYLTRLRMETAAYLLANTDRPVNRIADELGYYDEFHFSKVFKEYAGVSPRAFKKQQKGSG